MFGKWLFLGDYDKAHSGRESIVNEQNNVALISALVLTMQFSFFMAIEGYDWKKVAENIGLTPTADAVEWIKALNYSMSLFSIVTTFCSMVFAAIMLLIFGELTGESEFTDYVKDVGAKVSGGFGLYMCGMCTFALHGTVFALLNLPNWGPRVVVAAFCGIPVGIIVDSIVMTLLAPSVHSLYKIKLTRQTATLYGPVVYSMQELEQLREEFCLLINPEYISPTAFTQ